MGDEIGVAAVRRGGMGVVVDGEAEVAFVLGAGIFDDVFAGAHGFQDGEGEFGEVVGIGGALGGEEIVEGFGIGLVGELGAKLGDDGLDAIPTFRDADHAADGEGFFFAQVAGHGDVGGDHETFNDVAGGIAIDEGIAFNFAADDHGDKFNAAESECAVVFAEFHESFAGFELEF